jgi:hypothetical protein
MRDSAYFPNSNVPEAKTAPDKTAKYKTQNRYARRRRTIFAFAGSLRSPKMYRARYI